MWNFYILTASDVKLVCLLDSYAHDHEILSAVLPPALAFKAQQFGQNRRQLLKVSYFHRRKLHHHSCGDIFQTLAKPQGSTVCLCVPAGYVTGDLPECMATGGFPQSKPGPPEGSKEFSLSAPNPHICANIASSHFKGPQRGNQTWIHCCPSL